MEKGTIYMPFGMKWFMATAKIKNTVMRKDYGQELPFVLIYIFSERCQIDGERYEY